jgi:hypothetical protein
VHLRRCLCCLLCGNVTPGNAAVMGHAWLSCSSIHCTVAVLATAVLAAGVRADCHGAAAVTYGMLRVQAPKRLQLLRMHNTCAA